MSVDDPEFADPEFADAELAEFVSGPSAFGTLDVGAIRAAIESRATTREPGPRLHAVADLELPTCPARLYRPAPGPGPLVVYLHGGGWSVGSVASYDRVLRRLARSCGAAVLALDYRLAPEHRWPASVEDTVAALRWVAAAPPELGGRPHPVAVAGDSAGGTLAALACRRLRDEHPEALPDLQLLLYANTDLTGAWPSMAEKATGFGHTAESVRFFNRQWVPDERRWSDPGVSPLHAPDLSGLPAAVIVTAEHDPLRDEAEAYAGRLRDARVPVTARRERGMIHNFLQLADLSPAASAAFDRVAADLATALRGTGP